MRTIVFLVEFAVNKYVFDYYDMIIICFEDSTVSLL